LQTAPLVAPQKILLVDDHELILKLLEALLAAPSITFLRATNGVDALQLTRREHPDVVVMDVCMPGMDGLEVCAAIKGDPALAETRVALMSAVIGERGLREGGEEVGADAYFGKPFNSESVKREVCALLCR
jgi:CheY-like chemotaxis protein